MRFSRFIYTLTSLGIFTVSLLSFTGCGESKFELTSEQKSPQGIALEDVMPPDTMMFFSINTQNEQQREKLENLKSYFPQEDMEKLIKSAVDDLNMDIKDAGMTYENDIAPLFGEKFKVVFGITGEFPKLPKTKLKKGEKPAETEPPEMIIAFTVQDTKKAEEIMNLMAEKNSDITSSKVFEYPAIENKSDDMYMALYKDVVVMATTENNRFEAVKRLRNNENSLLANENFKKALQSLPEPNIGIVYINVYKLFDEISKASDEKMPSSDFVKALQFEAFALTAEDDGLQMIVQVGMDKNNKKFNIDTFPYEEPYLYKNIPGNDMIIFAEAYGIKQIFDVETDVLLTDENDKENLARIKRLFKKYVGLDMENDIFSWMDKGYAIAIQRNDGLIPGISLYVDASGNAKSAQKTLEVIDAAFAQMIETIMTQGDPLVAKVLKKEVVKMGETDDELNLLSVDFTALTDEEMDSVEIPNELFNEPFEIYYGLTKNNLFVFSTYTGLKDDWGKKELTVAENETIKESLNYLKEYPYQFSYINIPETVKYADRFIELMETAGGKKLPKDVAEAYQKVKDYLAPIKYLVGGNQKVENIAEGLLFIKMEKPAEENLDSAAVNE